MRKVAWTLMVCGVVLIGWNLYHFCEGYFSYSEPKLEQTQSRSVAKKSHESKIVNSTPLYGDIPSIGERIGELTIPKLNKTFPIFQGTDEKTLRKGVGHFPKSALPGEKNNTVLSGHRDTVFRGLKDIEKNDRLLITTSAGEFLFKVKKIRIVDATDRTVLTPKPKSTLTLTTCYPFYFIGNAPQRYIVVGDLVSTKVAPHYKENSPTGEP